MALFGYYQGRDQVRPVKDANGVIQRTNTALEVSDGDAPAQKWLVDNRLPVLFKYGFAAGVNEMTMSKGLIVAVDPVRFQRDFESGKMHSVLTVANGGKNVKLNGTTWEALVTGVGSEDETYEALTDAEKDADLAKRAANKPAGVLFANVYKKVDDQLSGMAPTVITRKYIKLPLFAAKDKAMLNPWGSAYGSLRPGDFVKSDENGRFVKFDEETDLESQKLGQVLAIQKDLVPEGAAIWATWALEDRLNSDYFNPLERPQTDNTAYPGYPYDKSYGYNELNKQNPRFPDEYFVGAGIPGLTDGSHVAASVITDQVVDVIPAQLDEYSQSRYCRTLERGTQIEAIQVAVQATVSGTVRKSAYVSVAANAVVKINVGAGDVEIGKIEYADNLAGLFVIKITQPAVLKTVGLTEVKVLAAYSKKGLAGVPTMLDWDGVVGEVRVLLQK